MLFDLATVSETTSFADPKSGAARDITAARKLDPKIDQDMAEVHLAAPDGI